MPETSPRVFTMHSQDVAVVSQLKVRRKVPTCSQRENTLQSLPGRRQPQVAGAAPSRLPSEMLRGAVWTVWAAFSDTQPAESRPNQDHQKVQLQTRDGTTVLASSNSGCLIKQVTWSLFFCHLLLNRPCAVHGITAAVEDCLFLHFGHTVLKWNEISL